MLHSFIQLLNEQVYETEHPCYNNYRFFGHAKIEQDRFTHLFICSYNITN
uniref:Uncharacterized protein n=1 Tax=Ciona intestinalis TaxID=7719 RepID=H2XSI4_CIOIN